MQHCYQICEKTIIRIENAWKLLDIYNQLMENRGTNDSKLFHRLIANQRSTQNHLSYPLKKDGTLITEPADLIKTWAEHYESLGKEL